MVKSGIFGKKVYNELSVKIIFKNIDKGRFMSYLIRSSGHNSVVEYKLPKLGVASSNLVARSIRSQPFSV